MSTVNTAGIEIPYVVEGDGSEPTMVFAHGLSSQGEQIRAWLAPLVEAGWTLVSFDQRGHAAASAVLDRSDYDLGAMGADLWTVADAVGIDRCWIGGGSMGAATSFRSATQQPDRVEGLVQVAPALASNEHPHLSVFDKFADELRDGGIDGVIAAQTEVLQKMRAPIETIERLEELRVHDPASLETAFRTVPRWVLPDFPSAFAGFSFPVVVIGCKNDPIHPFDLSEAVAAAAGVEAVELDFAELQRDRVLLGRALAGLLPAVASVAPQGDSV